MVRLYTNFVTVLFDNNISYVIIIKNKKNEFTCLTVSKQQENKNKFQKQKILIP